MAATCDLCGAELVIGSYPFCKGNPEDHDTVRSLYAKHFEPLLVDFNPDTGQHSYVGSAHAPVPAGYVRRSLETLNQIDQFCDARSREETEKKRDFLRAEKQFWDDRIQQRREFVRAEMQKRGFKGRGWDRICQFLDERREKKHDERMRREVHVFSDVMAFDSSNRNPHSSAATDWKQRKA